ncbi:MAG: hypothetical protein Q8K79_07675 [Solirubrobacteraceae bacterium]|nr:hypothetical protein [Solirubrobacteraceae bacterium]
MDRMQEAAFDSVRDCAAPEAERRELPRRDDAVLPRRHASDQQVHMHYCRIEILPADVRQNRTAYMQFCRRS